MRVIYTNKKQILIIAFLGIGCAFIYLLYNKSIDIEKIALFAFCIVILASLQDLRRRISTTDQTTALKEQVSRLEKRAINDRQQQEAIIAIYSTLQPSQPLPPTGGWAASPDFLHMAIEEILSQRPKNILELGSGVSSLALGYCIKRYNLPCRVWSLDHDHDYAEKTRRLLKRHQLDDYVQVLNAPIVEHRLTGRPPMLWYATDGIPDEVCFDLVIVDGPPANLEPEARYPVLPLLRDRLRDGSVLLFDDASRPGERSIIDRFHAEYPNIIITTHCHEKGTTKIVI